MTNIYIDTNIAIKKALEDIFETNTIFTSVDITNAHICISSDENKHYTIPTLYLGKDVLIPTTAKILLKYIYALSEKSTLNTPISLGNITLNPAISTVEINNTSYTLTDKEVDIMYALLKNKTMYRDELLKYVWEYENDTDTHTVQTHIYRLRKKIGTHIIETTNDGAYFLRVS